MAPKGGILWAVGYTKLEFKGEVQAGDINLKVISTQVVADVSGHSTGD